jgi:hypothetical protein
MLRSFSRKENLILLQIGMTDGHDIETNWIPGHPERTIPNSDIWSKHMWGNFMADGAAAGEWDYLKWGVAGDHRELGVTEILQGLAKDPLWMWVDVNGTPITASIPNTIREKRFEKYLFDRDGYRAMRGEPPIWDGTKAAFASLQFQLNKTSRGDRGRRVRIIWDKGWHGGNIAKSGKAEVEDTLCVLCGMPDGQRHWLVECTHAPCIIVRENLKVKLNELTSTIGRERREARLLAELIGDWAWTRADADRIWTGLWSPTLLRDMEATLGFGLMITKKVEELQAVAMSLGRVFAATALALWDIKVHEGKNAVLKVAQHAKVMTAAAQLKRAKEKETRNKKQKSEREEQAKELARVAAGKHSEDMKQRHKLAVWFGKVPKNMTLNEFAHKYNECKDSEMWGHGGVIPNFLSTSLVRGRLI